MDTSDIRQRRHAHRKHWIAWTNAWLIDEVAPSAALVRRMQLDNSPGVPNTSAYDMIRITNLRRYAEP